MLSTSPAASVFADQKNTTGGDNLRATGAGTTTDETAAAAAAPTVDGFVSSDFRFDADLTEAEDKTDKRLTFDRIRAAVVTAIGTGNVGTTKDSAAGGGDLSGGLHILQLIDLIAAYATPFAITITHFDIHRFDSILTPLIAIGDEWFIASGQRRFMKCSLRDCKYFGICVACD